MSSVNVPIILSRGSNNCYAIRNPSKIRNSIGHDIWFTILDPWNRGFYATCEPKLFTSKKAAEQFCQNNCINRYEIVLGFFEPSQGFFPHAL